MIKGGYLTFVLRLLTETIMDKNDTSNETPGLKSDYAFTL